MASGNEMLETCSGSGSSDSFINLSRSGASSIQTLATTNSTFSTTTEETLYAKVQKLHEEKKALEGRIRGFKTLSDLLVECRKENELLKLEVHNLTQLTQQQARANMSVSSPFSLVSTQASQDKPNDLPDLDTTGNLVLHPDQLPNKAASPTVTYPGGESFPPVSYPPTMDPLTSLQETVGPPDDGNETKLISFAEDSRKASSALVQEVAPKQESLTMEPVKNGSYDDKACFQRSPTSGHSSPELLQPDSDKYEEATYEKIGLHRDRGRAQGYYGSPQPSSREEPRATDFPSLSSGLSTGMPHSHSSSHGSVINPMYLTMMHQSYLEAAPDKANSGLAAEVESLTERLHSEPSDGSPAIAVQMQQIVERISKVELKERDQKKLISALMQENQKLKLQVKMADSSHQKEAVMLREQNTRLMQQLKNRRDEDTTVIKSTGTQGDWVHVERPKLLGASHNAETDHFLVDRVRKLELEKAELLRANSNWKSQWDKMERSHQMATDELRSKVSLSEQEISGLKSSLNEQASQFESRMLEMKRRIEDEESQKEDALHQLRLAERQQAELQGEMSEVRTQLSDTARDKQALTAELSVLKAQAAGPDLQQSRAGESTGTTRAALEAEIAMLKVQVKVFAEDFEHEREDRTIAQSARDSAKKNAETLARQSHTLSSQVQLLQKQIKDRDDTISWTLQQNETMKRQISDLKKKLDSEWEEKQKLHRMLAAAQQQQQQPHQNLRTPYRAPDPQPLYGSSSAYQLLQQPPPSGGANNTTPFYGSRNHQVPCPEHLPGAWTCSACTYINYPGRTVCDSCGLVNSPRSHYPDNFGFPSQDSVYGSYEHALLMSRGGDQAQNGRMLTSNDLVTDAQA